jgi:hypothetical protein
MLFQQEVADYNKLKPFFDTTETISKDKGISKTIHVHNERNVTLLMEIYDMKKAQTFVNSQELKDLMERSGIINKPEISFLAN